MLCFKGVSLTTSRNAALVHKVSQRAMDVMDYDPVWSGPMGRLAVLSTVETIVGHLIQDGMRDECALLQAALDRVSGARPEPVSPPSDVVIPLRRAMGR